LYLPQFAGLLDGPRGANHRIEEKQQEQHRVLIVMQLAVASLVASAADFVQPRHPKALPIKSVTVNGNAWTDFDASKEAIRLHDVSGSVKVEASY
jgi:hypothetical protein